MKKKSGWIAFLINQDGKIAIAGSEMYPKIYRTKKETLKAVYSYHKGMKPFQPVKIKWTVEE